MMARAHITLVLFLSTAALAIAHSEGDKKCQSIGNCHKLCQVVNDDGCVECNCTLPTHCSTTPIECEMGCSLVFNERGCPSCKCDNMGSKKPKMFDSVLAQSTTPQQQHHHHHHSTTPIVQFVSTTPVSFVAPRALFPTTHHMHSTTFNPSSTPVMSRGLFHHHHYHPHHHHTTLAPMSTMGNLVPMTTMVPSTMVPNTMVPTTMVPTTMVPRTMIPGGLFDGFTTTFAPTTEMFTSTPVFTPTFVTDTTFIPTSSQVPSGRVLVDPTMAPAFVTSTGSSEGTTVTTPTSSTEQEQTTTTSS